MGNNGEGQGRIFATPSLDRFIYIIDCPGSLLMKNNVSSEGEINTMKEKTIRLQEGKYYHSKDLSLYLKKIGLPFSRTTLLKYEREGVLPEPKRIKYYNKSTRIYTAKEIRDISLKIYTAIANHVIQPR